MVRSKRHPATAWGMLWQISLCIAMRPSTLRLSFNQLAIIRGLRSGTLTQTQMRLMMRILRCDLVGPQGCNCHQHASCGIGVCIGPGDCEWVERRLCECDCECWDFVSGDRGLYSPSRPNVNTCIIRNSRPKCEYDEYVFTI